MSIQTDLSDVTLTFRHIEGRGEVVLLATLAFLNSLILL